LVESRSRTPDQAVAEVLDLEVLARHAGVLDQQIALGAADDRDRAGDLDLDLVRRLLQAQRQTQRAGRQAPWLEIDDLRVAGSQAIAVGEVCLLGRLAVDLQSPRAREPPQQRPPVLALDDPVHGRRSVRRERHDADLAGPDGDRPTADLGSPDGALGVGPEEERAFITQGLILVLLA
jgi:hypothetical protein